ASISAVATLFGPLAGFDLRHAGPLDGLREALAEPLRHLVPEPEGGIVRGIVLGERAAVDADLATAFARSGTSHLLAISGFNMTLVATAVALVARGRVRRAIRQGLATTLAATLPTIPIIAAVFGRVSLVSPLANLVAVPLFPPLMLAGAATAVLGTVSPDLAMVPALLAYALASGLRLVVET